MKTLKSINLRTGTSSSISKKTDKLTQSSRVKHMKARQHQAIKKFNKTVNQVKKTNIKILQENIQINNTARSKTPSPLKQLIINSNNMTASVKHPNVISNLKNMKQQKTKDENFIQILFNSSKKKKKEKQKQKTGQYSRNSKEISSKSKGKSKQNQIKEDKVDKLQQSLLKFEKAINDKNLQIKMLTDKIHCMEQECQKLTLNACDVISVINMFYKRQIPDQVIIGDFIEKKIGILTQNIELMVKRLKLQGKIKLKANILDKQLERIFEGHARAQTEGRQTKDIGINEKQQQVDKHHKSESSQGHHSKRKQEIQIFIDIISRRESIPSSRKGLEEDKKLVIKSFNGIMNAHELILEKGDTITVLKTNANGWWIGIKNGVVGYFPSDCLQ